jgi:hypothetical protein
MILEEMRNTEKTPEETGLHCCQPLASSEGGSDHRIGRRSRGAARGKRVDY